MVVNFDKNKYDALLKRLENKMIRTVIFLKRAIHTDGEHHKVWLINQSLKNLLGMTEYTKYMDQYKNKKYFGIAP